MNVTRLGLAYSPTLFSSRGRSKLCLRWEVLEAPEHHRATNEVGASGGRAPLLLHKLPSAFHKFSSVELDWFFLEQLPQHDFG